MFNTLGGMYFVEGVILPCDNAVDIVVEDSDLDPIFMTIFNESDWRQLNINGYMVWVNSTIVQREYSMDIAVSWKDYICM